jgi:hypothetical protein
MRRRALTLILTAITACASALVVAHDRPLSHDRVNELLGPDPDLVFFFATGPDHPDLACSRAGAPQDDADAQTATAIAVGWLARRCEDDHIQLRLTPEGKRLSSHWSRSGDSPGAARAPEDPGEWTFWSVPVARFERIGSPEIQKTEFESRRRVIVKGQWAANGDGQRLQRVGWQGFRDRAERDETLELRIGGWHRIPSVIGHDLSGL